jgi:hypothetical protein
VRIPDVQERLHQLADALIQPLLLPIPADDIGRELHHLANLLSRRSSVPKAPPAARKLTVQLKAEIKAYREANPDQTYEQIAQRFGVNVARVSESVRGKRK